MPGAYQAAWGGNPDAFVAKLNPTGAALVYSTYLGGSDYDYGNGIAIDSSGNAYITGWTTGVFPTADAYQRTFGGIFDVFVAKLNSTGAALVYSTYLGGSDGDRGNGIAVDSSGNAYITGSTESTNFPTTAGAQVTSGGNKDAFIAKLSSTGTALVYSTYLGGSAIDVSNGIAVDSIGNAYITGYTYSSNFPTTGNAYQTVFSGSLDAFVAKLNSPGSSFVYSTYLGGSGSDRGNGIAVDSSGNAYITGSTE